MASSSLQIAVPTIRLEGEIRSDDAGFAKLLQFYQEAAQYKNQQIRVDCYDLKWIDANLAAVLLSFDHLLLKNYRVSIHADFDFLARNFCFLFENGWLKHSKHDFPDVQKRTLLCTQFLPSEQYAFLAYIKEKLMVHSCAHSLPGNLKAQIESDLLEIFGNVERHAATSDPLFVCGHYYAAKGYLVFTMVDLGVGFLQPIAKYTHNAISTSRDAIDWALSGKSTTGEILAGMGLEGIKQYCNDHDGGLQIITGDAFWGTKLPCPGVQGHSTLKKPFHGSIINLFFPFRG